MMVIISLGLSFLSYQLSGKYIHLMMMYNLGLALVAYGLQKIELKSMWIKIPIKILWILFLPNTFYMLTDLIHIGLFTFKATADVYSQVYVQNIIPWVELISFVFIICMGCLLGLKSIYHEVHQYDYRLHKLLMIGLAVLNAVGVYIGRYLRLNSWDIFNPIQLFKTIYSNLSLFSLEFILIFSILFSFIIMAYDAYKEK